MKIKAVWEFDADVSDISPKHVDVEGLAKDFAKLELEHLLRNNELSAEDFTFICGHTTLNGISIPDTITSIDDRVFDLKGEKV